MFGQNGSQKASRFRKTWASVWIFTNKDAVYPAQRSSLIPSGNEARKNKPKMRRGDQIEVDNGDGGGFLDPLAELFLMGMATADPTPIK